MRFPGFVLLASGVLGIVNASDLNPPPQTISSSPSYAGDRRAGATATVTLGPSSDHIVDLVRSARLEKATYALLSKDRLLAPPNRVGQALP